jgi:P27 family predicted phage terminase small subunit
MSRRKTTGFHQLAGSFRADRHTKSGLQFPPATGTAPRWLNKAAKAEWKRIAPFLLEQGLLTETDISVLAVYCNAFAGYLECAKKVELEGHTVLVESQTRTGHTSKPIRNPAVTLMLDYQRAMLSAASKFGFSPYDRERIEGSIDSSQTDTAEDDDDDDSFLYAPLEVHPTGATPA